MYELLEKLLVEKGISAYRLSKDTGIPTSSLTDWKKGRSKPKLDKLQILADYFCVSVSYLSGETTERAEKKAVNDNFVQLPLYNQICCGTGCFIDDEIIEYISLPDTMLNKNSEYFAQYAKGDSMINENINDGDLLIFEKTCTLENGQVGCFCANDDYAMCKKFYKTSEGVIMLNPSNDEYDPIIISESNNCFRVLGKLALIISKTKY
ncbi:MAG: XRE family transcriptional regulator [Myroides sp.]